MSDWLTRLDNLLSERHPNFDDETIRQLRILVRQRVNQRKLLSKSKFLDSKFFSKNSHPTKLFQRKIKKIYPRSFKKKYDLLRQKVKEQKTIGIIYFPNCPKQMRLDCKGFIVKKLNLDYTPEAIEWNDENPQSFRSLPSIVLSFFFFSIHASRLSLEDILSTIKEQKIFYGKPIWIAIVRGGKEKPPPIPSNDFNNNKVLNMHWSGEAWI